MRLADLDSSFDSIPNLFAPQHLCLAEASPVKQSKQSLNELSGVAATVNLVYALLQLEEDGQVYGLVDFPVLVAVGIGVATPHSSHQKKNTEIKNLSNYTPPGTALYVS